MCLTNSTVKYNWEWISMNCKSFCEPLHHSDRVHHALETKELQHKYLCSQNENWIASVTCVYCLPVYRMGSALVQKTWWKEQSQRSGSASGIRKIKSYAGFSNNVFSLLFWVRNLFFQRKMVYNDNSILVYKAIGICFHITNREPTLERAFLFVFRY